MSLSLSFCLLGSRKPGLRCSSPVLQCVGVDTASRARLMCGPGAIGYESVHRVWGGSCQECVNPGQSHSGGTSRGQSWPPRLSLRPQSQSRHRRPLPCALARAPCLQISGTTPLRCVVFVGPDHVLQMSAVTACIARGGFGAVRWVWRRGMGRKSWWVRCNGCSLDLPHGTPDVAPVIFPTAFAAAVGAFLTSIMRA